MAHFHDAPPGSPGPIVRHITASEGAVSGVTSGVLSGTWTSTDADPLTPALVADLFAGRIYVNIHSTQFRAGEIRGQLTLQSSTVPEPAAWSLMALGLAGALAFAAGRRSLRPAAVPGAPCARR